MRHRLCEVLYEALGQVPAKSWAKVVRSVMTPLLYAVPLVSFIPLLVVDPEHNSLTYSMKLVVAFGPFAFIIVYAIAVSSVIVKLNRWFAQEACKRGEVLQLEERAALRNPNISTIWPEILNRHDGS